MQLYGKAESAALRIIDTFKSGRLPKALAPVFIRRRDNVPCRAWSWSNQLLAALAGHDDARGFRQWETVGRHVTKGQKAFYILCPVKRTITATDAETGETAQRMALVGFRAQAVFGYEQTDGAALPDRAEADAFIDALPVVNVARHWNLTVGTFNGQGARYRGYYKHGSGIALGVENLIVWAHELVHAADDRNGTITKRSGQQLDNEVVAQLGASTLLQCLGHEHEADLGFCWDYIQQYAAQHKKQPIAVCQKLLQRVCESVALILATADKLAGQPVESEVAA